MVVCYQNSFRLERMFSQECVVRICSVLAGGIYHRPIILWKEYVMGKFKLICPNCNKFVEYGGVTWDSDCVKDAIMDHTKMVCQACGCVGLDFYCGVRGLKEDLVLSADRRCSEYSIPVNFNDLPYNGIVVAVFAECAIGDRNPDRYLLVIQQKTIEGYRSNVVSLKYNDYDVMTVNLQQVISNLPELLEVPMGTIVRMDFRLNPI